MASTLRSRSPLPGPTRRSTRWIAVGLVSVAVHLTAFDLLPRWSLEPGDDAANDLPLRVTLMPPVQAMAASTDPVVPPPPPDVLRTKPTRPIRPRPAPPEPAFVPESYEPVAQVTVPPPANQAPSVASAPPAPAATPPAAAETAAPPPAPLPPPPPAPQAVAPTSARLYYKVAYVDLKSINPVRYYGVGTIDWRIVDGRYRSELVASYDLVLAKYDLLVLHSDGSVTAAGLVPDRYTEKTGRRATLATNFNRDARQSITFSANTTSATLVPGAQDRLSVLFQVGALLLADSLQPVPSSRVTIPVAGVRGDVEPWVFEVIGVESIEAGGDPLSTTHLRRAPRPESNDRTIDVWIAQTAGGYPARVLYTEPNGSTTQMTLDRIGRLADAD